MSTHSFKEGSREHPTACLHRNWVLRGSTGCGLLLILLLVLTGVPRAISQTGPYSISDVEKLAKQGTEERAFLESVKHHGIDFAPTVEVIAELKANQVPQSVLKEIWEYIPQSQPPEFYLREGDRFLTNGYYAEAVAYYQRILVLIPDDPSAKERIKQAIGEQKKAEAVAEEERQKAEAASELRAAQDGERPNLTYYRQQLGAFLLKSDCDGAFYYAHKIFFVGPDQSEQAALEKVCGTYSLKLEHGTLVTVRFPRDLKGSGEHSGERVALKVVDQIMVNGFIVVSKDGDAWGTITKSKGGSSLLRAGRLGISIDGVSLADGEECPLAAAKTYRGAKKSKKAKTGIVIGSVFTAGLPIIRGKGHDVIVAAGTKVTANVTGTMNLDPARFPLGPAPEGDRIIIPTVVRGLNVISFQNQSGTDATVRLIGPSSQVLTVADGQSFGALVAAGNYYVLVRYGRIPSEYLFEKGGPVSVTEPSGERTVAHVTLQRPAADNPKAREEFDRGQ
jgi:hypothetical protein